MNYLIAIVISILGPILWIGTILGFPGNWGLVILTIAVAYFAPSTMPIDVELPTIMAAISMAVLGEVVEFFAGAAGVNQLGGSKRGTALAIAGSIVGAIAGVFIGVPVPIIGSLIAAIAFGGLGAFGGAVAGERWAGKDWDVCIRIGWGALWGKLLGTLLKTICGTVIMCLLVYAVWN